MTTTQTTVTAADSNLIARANRLRSRVWALHYEQGGEFARNLAALWRQHGMAGIGIACAALQHELSQVPGAHDCFVEARAIAAAAPR